jgi:hypothetical protein
MKIQKIMRGMALAAVTALVATTAVAQQVTVSQIPGYHANAGEFNVTPIIGHGYDASVMVGNGFETFCISRTAYLPILPGQYFGSVDINGIHQPENVAITKGMAWLYAQFAAGTLVGYDYADTAGSGRTDSAYQLQLAIWILEGQYSIDAIQPDSNPFLNEAMDFFGGGAAGLAVAMSPNTPGDYNVGVLNLNVINPDGSIGAIAQPMLVLLEPTPPCPCSPHDIKYNFNGTQIAFKPLGAQNYVWFISDGKVSGLPSNQKVTLHVYGQTITISVNPAITVNVPDAFITFDPNATTATTTFDTVNNVWRSTFPSSGLAGNLFYAGVAFPVPAGGLPGGIKNVDWSGQFSADTAGLSVNWQWHAAAYSLFNSDYNSIMVKPVDDNHKSAYQNSNHAGTPEGTYAGSGIPLKTYVIGGASGGGGGNYTGSGSSTIKFPPCVCPNP